MPRFRSIEGQPPTLSATVSTGPERAAGARNGTLTGELRSQVDRIWDTFWSGGIANPLVKVTALEALAAPRRLGFLAGEVAVPDDFDRLGEAEIAALFGNEE